MLNKNGEEKKNPRNQEIKMEVLKFKVSFLLKKTPIV
jgi:hypothetical protein